MASLSQFMCGLQLERTSLPSSTPSHLPIALIVLELLVLQLHG